MYLYLTGMPTFLSRLDQKLQKRLVLNQADVRTPGRPSQGCEFKSQCIRVIFISDIFTGFVHVSLYRWRPKFRIIEAWRIQQGQCGFRPVLNCLTLFCCLNRRGRVLRLCYQVLNIDIGCRRKIVNQHSTIGRLVYLSTIPFWWLVLLPLELTFRVSVIICAYR